MSDPSLPPAEPPDSSELLARIAAGDEVARRTFFDVHAPTVFRFVSFTFRLDDDDTDDVVQETMMAALERVGTYNGSTKLITWIFGIAKHKAIDHVRERSAEVPWSMLGADESRATTMEETVEEQTVDESRGHVEHVEDEGGPSLEEIEAGLGDAAVDPREDDGSDVSESLLPDTRIGTATAPPPPPRPGTGSEPFRSWAGEIATWLASQPEEVRIVARRFTHEASYEQLAADLAEHLGEPVKEPAVRQRVSRFKRAFYDRFQHLLPPSRIRPSGGIRLG